MAGTPLITAEIVCHLYPPSETFIDVNSGGEPRRFPNYSRSKAFYVSAELIHRTACKICKGDGAVVVLLPVEFLMTAALFRVSPPVKRKRPPIRLSYLFSCHCAQVAGVFLRPAALWPRSDTSQCIR